MKIMVTGGAGFIGSAMIRKAIAQGHDILNIDCLTYAANLDSLKSVSANRNYAFEKIDIRDADAISAAVNEYSPEAIMHLAAESHVDRSIDGPGDFMQTNIIGSFNLLQAARGHFETLSGVARDAFRFQHISTDEVYGDLTPDDPAFTEDTPYDPSSPYSASKAASDHLVRAWARTYGLPVLITNCSNNYGPYQFPEKLIPVVILNALHGNPIPVYGKGENIRDWLFVDDHADALLAVLAKGKTGETYNIGGHNERTNIDLVRTICALMDDIVPSSDGSYADLIEFVTDRPGHDQRYAINADKIEEEIGWTPSVNFDEGFERTIRWYLENEGWWRPLVGQGSFETRRGIKAEAGQ